MKGETGSFCALIGTTPRNAVLEYFLEARELDHAASDVIDELDMNKATAYAAIHQLLAENLITPTRTIGKTQLYTLSKNENTESLKILFHLALHPASATRIARHLVAT